MKIDDRSSSLLSFMDNSIIEKETRITKNDHQIKKYDTNEAFTRIIYTKSGGRYVYNSTDGKVVEKATKSIIDNQQYQSKLSSLGFYNGPIDGVLTSSVSQKAIRNFQRVYGLSQSGVFNSTTENMLNNVYSSYQSVYNSSQLASISSSSNFGLDSTERANFARIWAFLRVGMGATATQAAGVMGNIYAESRFSSDNAYNSYYPGDHNPSYSYNSNDGIAYGIAQWADPTRKAGLQTESNTMSLSVSDINAQLAFLRNELTGSYSSTWNSIVGYGNVNSVSDAFYYNFEGGSSSSVAIARQNFSNTIYNSFYSF